MSTIPPSNISSLPSPEELIKTTVTAVTGFSVDELPEPTRSKMIKQCTDMLVGYIINYVKINFGEKEALQFKGIAIYNTPEIFETNPQLTPMFLEAFDSFINTLN
jgi:hypothetical protein